MILCIPEVSVRVIKWAAAFHTFSLISLIPITGRKLEASVYDAASCIACRMAMYISKSYWNGLSWQSVSILLSQTRLNSAFQGDDFIWNSFRPITQSGFESPTPPSFFFSSYSFARQLPASHVHEAQILFCCASIAQNTIYLVCYNRHWLCKLFAKVIQPNLHLDEA